MNYAGQIRIWRPVDGVTLFKREPFRGTAPDLAGAVADAKTRLSTVEKEWLCAADLVAIDNDGDTVKMTVHRGRNQ